MTRYSYSKPSTKYMVSLHTKVWIFYMLLAVGLSAWMGYFLEQRTFISAQQSKIFQVESSIYGRETNILKAKHQEINKKLKEMAHRAIYTIDIENAIKGVLEIIPDFITIHSITIDYSSLTIKGIVPSKEAFQMSLQQRLNSIFENSQVVFYPMGNGWFKFISKNSSTTPFIDKNGN
ncbi:hypothetical protein ACFOPX_00730 [Helicobacter baculiformis]|uniref:PilN n=1 Tax=Helicobacter baculiformis TaxID=427351 RepID=A0ABV7ZER4_9HELI|nr:hypothetical protein [Helicobacter baculiformis]